MTLQRKTTPMKKGARKPAARRVTPQGGGGESAAEAPVLRDSVQVIHAIKQGFPVALFSRLQSELGISEKELASVVTIAPRTLARRKLEGRMQADESDRLFRIERLRQRAVEVLGGTEAARRWLKSPKTALAGKTPLEFADTEPGAREVEDLLGRLEHGVAS